MAVVDEVTRRARYHHGANVRAVEAVYYSSVRFYFVLAILILVLLALCYRLVDLTVFDREFLEDQGNARSIRITQVPAYRGMIKDRNGEPLAISTPVYSIWVNPGAFKSDDPKRAQLASLLEMTLVEFDEKLKRHPELEFLYLRRSVPPSLANAIKSLGLKGIYLQREFKRFYPEGEISAHLIGFTNIDDQGQEGIELAYNDWLRGIPGKKRVHKNRLGHIIQELEVIREPRPGNDLVLSIDRRIQYATYRAVQKAVQTHKAVSGSAVVLDAESGEVLAMVNQPSFNPNKRPNASDGRYRNRAVTDLFEPGSVIKPFTIATALHQGVFEPESLVNTSPGWMVLGGNTIKDVRNFGEITVKDVLKRSSNVGVAKIILAIPPESYMGMLRRAGFGRSTNSGFPGESEGNLQDRTSWRDHTLATLAFGYSIAITPLQLAQSYSIFTGDGRLKPVSLLRLPKPLPAKKVIMEDISKTILDILETAVHERGGTGRRAQVKGYRIAGKTGTSRIAGPGGYYADRHIGSFVGIAPVSRPKVIIAVVIHDPQGKAYYGGLIAAPVFSEIFAETVRILDIPPDKTDDKVLKSKATS